MQIAETPKPPYYAVIMTTVATGNDADYQDMVHDLMEYVQNQPGFLGAETVDGGLGIMVSYWDSLDAIRGWKHDDKHTVAQHRGRSEWYTACKTRICRVEHEYGFS